MFFLEEKKTKLSRPLLYGMDLCHRLIHELRQLLQAKPSEFIFLRTVFRRL